MVLGGLFVTTWGGIAFAFFGGGIVGGLVWILFGALLCVLGRNFFRKPKLAEADDLTGAFGGQAADVDGETAEQRVLRRLEAMKTQGDATASAD